MFSTFPEINRISLPKSSAKDQSRRTPRIGIVVIGVSYTYVQEVLQRSPAYSTQLALFKIGSVYPFPEAQLHDFLLCTDVVLVLEELEPIIETHVLALIAETGLQVKVLGKRNGLLPRVGDYTMELVEKAVKVAIENDGSVTLPQLSAVSSNSEDAGVAAAKQAS